MEIETYCRGHTLAFVSPHPEADGKRVIDQSQPVIHLFLYYIIIIVPQWLVMRPVGRNKKSNIDMGVG